MHLGLMMECDYRQDRTQREAFDEAFARADEKLEAGAIEDALVAAIEAHGLADEGAAFLAEPRVRELIDLAERTATAAEEAGDWVQALSVYRLLDLLYDDRAT